MNNPIIAFWVITCAVTFAWLVAEFLFVYDVVRVRRTFPHSRKFKMLTVVVPIVESVLGIFLVSGWIRWFGWHASKDVSWAMIGGLVLMLVLSPLSGFVVSVGFFFLSVTALFIPSSTWWQGPIGMVVSLAMIFAPFVKWRILRRDLHRSLLRTLFVILTTYLPFVFSVIWLGTIM